MAQFCTSNMPDDAGRREFMKAGMAFLIAALWGARFASAQEKSMTNSMKPNTLPSVLTYDDVRAVSPGYLPSTRNWDRPASPCERKLLTLNLASRRKPRSRPGEQQLWAGLARTRAKHYRPALPRVVAPPRTDTSRSLVTVSAPIASGQVAQITYHLTKSRDGQRADSARGF